MFCTSGMSVAASFNIPVYYFFTTCACSMAHLLYFPTLHANTTTSIKDMNTFINLPGLPSIFSSEMPEAMLDRTSTDYSNVLDFSVHIPKSAGVIINTFDSLESQSIKAITDGLFLDIDSLRTRSKNSDAWDLILELCCG
ncbi:hypothetical protein L1887_07310 [Cichorium endivia]|nr:hypothetical protein L1887_07310 [Cichorium endivia]